jgi:hypothetical protein
MLTNTRATYRCKCNSNTETTSGNTLRSVVRHMSYVPQYAPTVTCVSTYTKATKFPSRSQSPSRYNRQSSCSYEHDSYVRSLSMVLKANGLEHNENGFEVHEAP